MVQGSGIRNQATGNRVLETENRELGTGNREQREVLPLSRTILILRGIKSAKYDTIAGLGRG